MHTSAGSTVSQSVRRIDRHTLACTNTHSPVSVPVKTGLSGRVSSFPVSSSRVGSGTAASANSFSWSHQSRTASAPRCETAAPAPCSHEPAWPAGSNHRSTETCSATQPSFGPVVRTSRRPRQPHQMEGLMQRSREAASCFRHRPPSPLFVLLSNL